MIIAIYRGPTRGYQLTYDDVLWLARGFVGEHGEKCSRKAAAALFHSWMDRFLLVNGPWLRERWNFWQLLRAHSQALKPAWGDPDSSKCKKHPSHCTPTHIARRHRIWGLTKKQLQAFGVWKYAVEAQAGDLARVIPAPCYDFAACSLTRQQNRPNAGVPVQGSCYLTYDSLTRGERSNVKKGEVVVSKITAERSINYVLGFAIVAIAVYCIWRFGS
jgi:hypothetical protein